MARAAQIKDRPAALLLSRAIRWVCAPDLKMLPKSPITQNSNGTMITTIGMMKFRFDGMIVPRRLI